MDELSLKRLETAEKLRSLPPAMKLLKAPFRMASSRWMSMKSRWQSRPVRTRAKLFWGDTMEVVFPDVVSIALYQYGFLETGLTRTVIEHVKPGMTFFDVGAHFGYFTLQA